MKKTFLIISFTILSFAAFAQHEVGTLTIQPKIGLNIANYASDDSSDPRFGIAAGAEFEYQISKMFSLSAGLLYSMQGCKSSGYAEGLYVKTTDKTDYINIPIMANVYVAKGFALKLGIQPALNVSAGYTIDTQGVEVNGDLSDVGVDVNSFDFSFPIGLSYEYKNFVAEARYNFGVTKVAKNFNDKNSVFQFTFGYKFKL